MRPHRTTPPRSLTIPCDQCGIPFARPASGLAGRTRHFCTRACYHAWRSAHERGPNSPTYRGGKLRLACEVCGAPCLRTPSAHRRRPRTFCNFACKNKAMFSGSGNPRWKGGLVVRACAQCGTPIRCTQDRLRAHANIFCNRTCFGLWRAANHRGAAHPLWRGGQVRYRGPDWPEQNRAARARDGQRCRICGGDRRLHVHHIVPFRDFGYIVGVNEAYKAANALSNLITLCEPCHRRVESGLLALPASP